MDKNGMSVTDMKIMIEKNAEETAENKTGKVKVKRKKEIDFKKQTDKKIRKLRKKEKRKKIRKVTGLIFLSVFIISVIWVIKTLYPEYKEIKTSVYENLSNMNENTFRRAGNTEIYDVDGEIIGQYGNEKYEYVTYDGISPYITDGYIAYEDRNFMVHDGVDYKAVIRAGVAYVKNKGEIKQGGSTITQQVVKNNILSSEQTFKRKLTEAMCARSLEKQYNKNQIMEFYCNSNYYGNGCYGVEGACRFYFGKGCDEVTLSEAAMLVATSNLPNVYNPVADYELCLDKRDLVLYAMYECDYITEEEYHGAVDERPVIKQESENVITNNYLTSFAMHCATEKVMELNGFTFRYIFDSETEYEEYRELYNQEYNETYDYIRVNGFRIYTSLSQDMQEILQETADGNLSEFDERDEEGNVMLQSAAVCIDNETGMVCAIVGGRYGEGYYNRGYQAKRQPGSTIKPLLDYGPAINEGYVFPGSTVTDEKTDYNGFVPQNAAGTYSGNMSVRQALLKSVNTVAVELYDTVSPETALSYLEKMRFSSVTYADTTALSVSVGGFTRGVSVYDMAKGYSTLAREGMFSDATCIISMSNYDGSIDYVYTESPVEVYGSDTAFMITDILRGYFEEENGAGYKYKSGSQIYAGKTGTTNDTKDVWFCGYSRYYTTAVWIGYDTPQEMEGISSSTYPCKIFTEFMDEIHTGKTPEEFPVPEGVCLINKSGDKKEAGYDTDIYKSRPDGWDYYSDRLGENYEVHLEKTEDMKKAEEAESAVSEFELYQIEDTDGAKTVEEYYNSVYEKVMAVSDPDKREELSSRLARKWDLINGELLDTWNSLIELEEEQEKERLEADNTLKAQESVEKAEKEKRKNIIDTAEWYITALNERTVYTAYTEELIGEGVNAVNRVSVYADVYEDVYNRFLEAAEYARSCPKETPEPEEIPTESMEKETEEEAVQTGSAGTFTEGTE